MSYSVKFYADKNGYIHGARATDQAGKRGDDKEAVVGGVTVRVRTVDGSPVVFMGSWYGTQLDYRPFAAAARAAGRQAGIVARRWGRRSPDPAIKPEGDKKRSDLTDTELTARDYSDGWAVEDADGGVWWPSEATAKAIAESASPSAAAVEACRAPVENGTWHS